jgi:hypothetical protein
MRCPIVDSQCPGPPADINAKRLPRKGLLEDPLTKVPGKEKAVESPALERSKKS